RKGALKTRLHSQEGRMSTLSTRNKIKGRVKGVREGEVMSEVTVDADGTEFVAAITRHSVERLGLAEGDTVTVLVKATEVMLAKGSETIDRLTTRNQIPGKISEITTGPAMAEVTVDVHDDEIVAVVTRHSVERLGLERGDDVVALVKATE